MSTLRDLFFIGLCTALLTFFGVLQRPIQKSSEGRVGRVAQEMLEDGDWAVPHLNGVVRIEKPPFASWLVALVSLGAAKLTGSEHGNVPEVQAWHVYVPPGLATIALVLLIYLWMKRLERVPHEKEKRVDRGMLAALALAAAPGFFIQARSAESDMLLALFVAAAFYGFWKSRAEGSRGGLLFAYAALGLSILTKGHVGLAIVVPALLSWLLIEHTRSALPPKRSASLWHAAGVLLILVIVLPWAIPFLQRSGFTWQDFNKEGLSGRVGSNVPHYEPFYWYAAMVPGWLMPWTLLLAAALWQTWSLPPDERSPLRRLCWIWLGWGLLLFSLLSSKQRHYVVPMFPAAALLVADTFARWWEHPDAARAKWARISLVTLSVLFAAGMLAGPIAAEKASLAIVTDSAALWTIAVLGGAVFVFAAVKLLLRESCLHLWWAGMVCAMVLFSRTVERHDAVDSPERFCSVVAKIVPPDEVLYDFDVALPTRKPSPKARFTPKPVWRAQVLFYLRRKIFPIDAEFSDFLNAQKSPVYAIATDKNLEGVEPSRYVVLHSEQKFLGHKNSVLLIRSTGR
ncbi:MAG TPA: glycosyltransferase family 39 protein [Planctomycetota bacterium]|nr:glycosyltransferase family 39 protein [Planctomycetota bacterium]